MFTLAERTTGPFAELMIRQSGLPSNPLDRLVVLDNACGTGVVATKLFEGNLLDDATRAKLAVTCADFSQAMVDATREKAVKNGWPSATDIVVADGMDTKFPSSHYTHVFFNFGPSLLRNPYAGIRECHRMLQPGGVFGFTAWEHIPWLDEYRPALEKFPGLPLPESCESVLGLFSETAEQWTSVDHMRTHLETNGFVDVEVQQVTRTTVYSFEDVVMIMPGTVGIFTSKLWTQEQRDTMTAPVVEVIKDHIREKHGDQPLQWVWKAFVVTGRKPE